MTPKQLSLKSPANGGAFVGRLLRYPGKGGWHFVEVPPRLAPAVTHGWGRTPVVAWIDGTEWRTSVWRGRDGRTLLPVPLRVRGRRGQGDRVGIRLAFNI
ncbi:MAG: DUF1905 domain-containing protein [Gemmatimonadota bacterium]